MSTANLEIVKANRAKWLNGNYTYIIHKYIYTNTEITHAVVLQAYM